MKKLSIFITVLFSLNHLIVNAQKHQTPIDTLTQAIIKFEHKILDLGKIKVNTKTIAEFNFINIGNKPLLIKNVNPTCGCTIAKYPKNPIKRGKHGKIRVEYSAPSFPSFIKKTIIVVTNSYEKTHLLTIKAEITK